MLFVGDKMLVLALILLTPPANLVRSMLTKITGIFAQPVLGAEEQSRFTEQRHFETNLSITKNVIEKSFLDGVT